MMMLINITNYKYVGISLYYFFINCPSTELIKIEMGFNTKHNYKKQFTTQRNAKHAIH